MYMEREGGRGVLLNTDGSKRRGACYGRQHDAWRHHPPSIRCGRSCLSMPACTPATDRLQFVPYFWRIRFITELNYVVRPVYKYEVIKKSALEGSILRTAASKYTWAGQAIFWKNKKKIS